MKRFILGIVVGAAISAAAFGGWMKVNSDRKTKVESRPEIVFGDETGIFSAEKRFPFSEVVAPAPIELITPEELEREELDYGTERTAGDALVEPIVAPLPDPGHFIILVIGIFVVFYLSMKLDRFWKKRRNAHLQELVSKFEVLINKYRAASQSDPAMYRELMIEYLSQALGKKLTRAAEDLARLTVLVRGELGVGKEVFPQSGEEWERAYARFHGIEEFPQTALLPLLILESIESRKELPLEELSEYGSIKTSSSNRRLVAREFRRMAEELPSLREQLRIQRIRSDVASEIEATLELKTMRGLSQ